MIPSSLETFSTCVDKEIDDNDGDDDDKAVIPEDEKRVVIKLEDSDTEENRGTRC
jgi:hypothetical protein